MTYEWDEAKRLKVLEKHGIDFLDVIEVLENEHVVLEARSEIEERHRAIAPSVRSAAALSRWCSR